MEGWLSLPEETGGIPFALRFVQGAYSFLVLGITGESINIIETPVSFSPEEHRLNPVPMPIVASFLRRSFVQSEQEEWRVLEPLLPESAEPMIFPPFDEKLARPTHRLRAPESGAYFSFEAEDIQEASSAILLAMRNPEVQRKLIDAAIDTLASFSLTLPKRQSWALAMEAVAILARIRYDDELAQLALQTASAIQSGVDGAQIPFIRDWADQSLQSVVALARVVEKAKHSPQGDVLESDTPTTSD